MAEREGLMQQLLEQEQKLQFEQFNSEMAWEIGLALKERAAQENKNVALDITVNGQCLFFHAMAGTTPDNEEWIAGKKKVVMRYRHSSYYVGRMLEKEGDSKYCGFLTQPRKFAPHGGCFPIVVKKVGLIGTITVSGLPQDQDHQLVVDVLTEYFSKEWNSP